MGSVVQKEAWVGPLDWADDQIKVINDDDVSDNDQNNDDDGLDLLSGLEITSRYTYHQNQTGSHSKKKHFDNDNS